MRRRTAYRTLLIRRRVGDIPPEQLTRFVEVQEAFRQRAAEWHRSGFKALTPAENPLKYFAEMFNVSSVGGFKDSVWRGALPFDAQLRLDDEGDDGHGVFVDLPRRVARIRKWGGDTITISLRESEVRWIAERVKEGGRLALAYAWTGRAKGANITTFNLALVFAREMELYQPRRLLVVDLNALHNGVVWAVVDGVRVLRKGVLRPDLGKIGRLQKEISRLDSLCAERGGRYCGQAVVAKNRLWRLLRQFEDEVAERLVHEAKRNKAAVVVNTPNDASLRRLKKSSYAPEKKIFLNVGRLKRRIRQLAGWYGVPYREERLYSTICPRCGAKMEELPNRRVRCCCGFETHRDKVPIMWAVKRFSELAPPLFPHWSFCR